MNPNGMMAALALTMLYGLAGVSVGIAAGEIIDWLTEVD